MRFGENVLWNLRCWRTVIFPIQLHTFGMPRWQLVLKIDPWLWRISHYSLFKNVYKGIPNRQQIARKLFQNWFFIQQFLSPLTISKLFLELFVFEILLCVYDHEKESLRNERKEIQTRSQRRKHVMTQTVSFSQIFRGNFLVFSEKSFLKYLWSRIWVARVYS